MLATLNKAKPEESKENRVLLGSWLRGLREKLHLSQRNLADALHLDYYTFISQLENGRGKIPAHRYTEWALALGQKPKPFVQKLLFYYEPETYHILFDE